MEAERPCDNICTTGITVRNVAVHYFALICSRVVVIILFSDAHLYWWCKGKQHHRKSICSVVIYTLQLAFAHWVLPKAIGKMCLFGWMLICCKCALMKKLSIPFSCRPKSLSNCGYVLAASINTELRWLEKWPKKFSQEILSYKKVFVLFFLHGVFVRKKAAPCPS